MSASSMATSTGHYDLCVVGAGYAGLNAAFVASNYLPSTARVLVLDKHLQAGGMWNDAYSYVRLHQPYRMFTVGNIAWSLDRERSYLATRDEVAAHLRHCFDVISTRLEVDARWGWESLGHTEEGGSVVVTARDPGGQTHSFSADRMIEAIGFDIEVYGPLALASQRVRSITPQQLADSGLLGVQHNEPVWVIGSGKTAMDTIVALVRANPARRLGIVSGAGTYFLKRDLINPTGIRRWVGGARYSSVFAEAAKHFDGTNADDVIERCRSRYGVSALSDPAPTHTLFALLSESEASTVASGVSEVIRDHLVDVIDDQSGPAMLLRTGVRHPVTPDSWVVNCTGYLAPRDVEHVPYVSSSGRTLSLNVSSATSPNFGASAFLLAHLFFLDKLADAPLYELDFPGVARTAPDEVLAVGSALMMYNLSVMLERLPLKAFRSFGLDIDRWYPPMRQLIGQLRVMLTHKRVRQHCRQALDNFSRRTNVRCGPLPTPAPAARPTV